MKNKYLQRTMIILQFICTIGTVVCMFLCAFDKKYFLLLQFLLGTDLVLMGINQKLLKGKNKVAIFYVLFGIVLLIFASLELMGVKI